MKKKTLKVLMITAAIAAVLVLAYNIAAAATLYAECDSPDKTSYVFSHLFSDRISVTMRKTVYRVFGAVSGSGVRSGRDGYLFPTKTDAFDYEADISGKAGFDAQTLEAFYTALCERRDAYALDGCSFLVVVIPNSQTVMTDKLRGTKPQKTAAEALEEYLYEQGFEGFYLMKSALSHSKYEPYHNTENAINGYGAYLVYRQITSFLPDQLGRRARQITLSDGDVTETYTDGRSLARALGLEKLAKNKDVYYPSRMLTDVYDAETSNGVTVSAMKEEYNSFIGRSELLVQCGPSYERSLFIPLFSATYTNAAYSQSLAYRDLTDVIKPSACVCIVREDELTSLLDKDDVRTYQAHIEGSANGGVTPAPVPVTAAFRADGCVIVAGQCEVDCSVTVLSGKDSVTVRPENGLFIAELKAEKGERLRFYAESDNRERSETSYFAAPSTRTADNSVYAGGGSMLCYGATFDDYTGANLLRSDRLSAVRERFVKTVEKIRSASGKDTRVIFLAAPDPLSVYPEKAPASVLEKRSDVTRLDQFKAALSDADGFVFLDVRAAMRENTDIEKLYYQTDTHWTEAGAYFGYRAIIEAVNASFPDVTPHSFNAFTLTYVDAEPGDLSGFAGLRGIRERVCLLKPKFRQRAVGLPEKPETIDRSVYGGELLSACNDDSLPTAVMIRDSYSANLFPLISEHFSLLYAQRMWAYEPDYKKISEYSPDFVIYVICERNLGMWE